MFLELLNEKQGKSSLLVCSILTQSGPSSAFKKRETIHSWSENTSRWERAQTHRFSHSGKSLPKMMHCSKTLENVS